MDISSFQCFFFILLTIFVTNVTSNDSNYREVEDEREFSYERNQKNGPLRWGTLKPEWKMCGNGKLQSPIDLLSEKVKLASDLGTINNTYYKPSTAILKNRGHDMMLKFEKGAGSTKISGIDYQLQQLHWHSPSEHTFNGKRFALELHMVHENSKGNIAVVALLYKYGKPDSFLRALEKQLSSVTDIDKAEKEIGAVDPRKIKIASREYYRYIGSLTTPPCTQNVTWTILNKVMTVSQQQVKLLRVAVHDDSDTNARPIQRANNRVVLLHKRRQKS